MASNSIRIDYYIGNTFIGDISRLARNRKAVFSLKSEGGGIDNFSFDVDWVSFKNFIISRGYNETDPALRVFKANIKVIVDGVDYFSGYLSEDPARTLQGNLSPTLSMNFDEHLGRLNGDYIRPTRAGFSAVATHTIVQTLINEAKARANAQGDYSMDFTFGTVDTLASKTVKFEGYKPTLEAILDMGNNIEGAGRFDLRCHSDLSIDILQPRGETKNITFKYPSDGVYRNWVSSYNTDIMSTPASRIIFVGAGEVGADAATTTAKIATAQDDDFAAEYGYYEVYKQNSGYTTDTRVLEAAQTSLYDATNRNRTPKITLTGRDIRWRGTGDDGLDVGDSFIFVESIDDATNSSGVFRIKQMDCSFDEQNVQTVVLTLLREV